MLSDSTNNQYAAALAGTAAADVTAVSSFSAKFTVLRFNSDNKKMKKKKGLSSQKSNKSRGKDLKMVSEFQVCDQI